MNNHSFVGGMIPWFVAMLMMPDLLLDSPPVIDPGNFQVKTMHPAADSSLTDEVRSPIIKMNGYSFTFILSSTANTWQ